MNQHILEAIEIVSAWDVPDEDFAQVVNNQARLMSGVNNPDEFLESLIDIIN